MIRLLAALAMSGPVTDAGKRLWEIIGGQADGLTVHMIQRIESEMVERMTRANVATHPADASVVFAARLTMAAPGRLVYHTPVGDSWDRTGCGRRICHTQGTTWINDMIAIRRDSAARIGRPCKLCRFDR